MLSASGFLVDWHLTDAERFSNRTRNRAYNRHLQKRYFDMDDEGRRTLTSAVLQELRRRKLEFADELEQRLPPTVETSAVISELTRRDIVEYLLQRPKSVNGRLDLIQFLKGTWDLDQMPSTDHRFENASGDIWQHVVNNEDWELDYLLGEYLQLYSCDEALFKRFVESCVNPIVVSNIEELTTLIGDLNGYLAHDGFELYETKRLSGRPICQIRPITDNVNRAKGAELRKVVRVARAEKPKVFVVYGHDQLSLQSVEIILHRIGCEPFIFSREARGAQTNIEFLERSIPTCDAVIAILTPDDEGRKKDTSDDLKPRARQNVLIEAGYALISKRSKSLLIAVGEVEIPSDFDGINRIQHAKWNRGADVELAKELASMLGLTIDISAL